MSSKLAVVHEFEANIEEDDRNRTYIIIPFDPREEWGRKQRYYVKGNINKTAFAGLLGTRNGRFYIPVNKELQDEAGVAAGDTVKIFIGQDAETKLEVPEELQMALDSSKEAHAFFEGLSLFYRNQYVKWIEEAKKEETRLERISKTIQNLRDGRRQK